MNQLSWLLFSYTDLCSTADSWHYWLWKDKVQKMFFQYELPELSEALW